MIIKDLTYLEVEASAAEVEGGGDVFQGVFLTQGSLAAVGGAGRNSIGNTALGLNIAIPTLTATGIL